MPDAALERIQSLPAGDDQATALTARTGRADWIEHLDQHVTESSVAAALADAGNHSAAVVPLNVDGRTLGVMVLGFGRPRRLTAEERSFALTAADQCAQALDRALAYARAERAAHRTAQLQEVTAAFSEARTPADVASVVVTQGCIALDAPRGLVGLLNDAGDTIDVLQMIGYPEETLSASRRLPMSEVTPLTDAVRSGTVVLVESVTISHTRYPRLAGRFTNDADEHALVAVPLMVRGRVLGVMGLAFDATRVFDDDDRTFMLALGRQCAQAIERARLYEAARPRAAPPPRPPAAPRTTSSPP